MIAGPCITATSETTITWTTGTADITESALMEVYWTRTSDDYIETEKIIKEALKSL